MGSMNVGKVSFGNTPVAGIAPGATQQAPVKTTDKGDTLTIAGKEVGKKQAAIAGGVAATLLVAAGSILAAAKRGKGLNEAKQIIAKANGEVEAEATKFIQNVKDGFTSLVGKGKETYTEIMEKAAKAGEVTAAADKAGETVAEAGAAAAEKVEEAAAEKVEEAAGDAAGKVEEAAAGAAKKAGAKQPSTPMERVHAEAKEAASKVKTLEEELKTLQADKKTPADVIAQKQEEIAQAKKVRSEKLAAQKNARDAQKTIQTAKRSVETLEAEVKKLSAESLALQDQVAVADKAASDALAKHEETLKALQPKIDKGEELTAAEKKSLGDLYKAKAETEKAAKEKLQESIAKEDEIKAKKQQLAEAKKTAAEAQERLDELFNGLFAKKAAPKGTPAERKAAAEATLKSYSDRGITRKSAKAAGDAESYNAIVDAELEVKRMEIKILNARLNDKKADLTDEVKAGLQAQIGKLTNIVKQMEKATKM